MINREINTKNAITRPGSASLDSILGHEYPILDHGMIRVIDYMGDDAAIVQAARVSYGAGTEHVQSDEALIRYLMRHWHSTPFEMCEIKLHVKLPVFVARQWIRHRTANVNEYSARYSILDGDFYIPEADKLALQSTTNNQGRGQLLDAERAADLRQYLRNSCDERYDIYRSHTDPNGEWNLARELARMDLPMNIYTQWYWKTDLHNLFHFLRLRADPHAQYEIRVYAELIHQLVKEWVPMATRAFEDYRLNAVNFSAMEMEMLRQYLSDIQDFGDGMNPPLLAAMKPTASMSVRERNEFLKKIGTK